MQGKYERNYIYKDSLCDKLIEHMAKGYSYESFAATIKVTRQCLYNWEKLYPDWKNAKEIAWDANLLFWESVALDNLIDTSIGEGMGVYKTKKLNAANYIFQMRNRHSWNADKVAEKENKEVKIMLAYDPTKKPERKKTEKKKV